MTLEPGTRLGHYRILGLLGRGGMADVYRAEDGRLGREVALKALPPEFARDPERVERFEREVRAAARLTHPNIVTVYEYGVGADQHFYTMALMPGGDLKARIRRHPDGMPPAEARAVAEAVARALAYAHEQGLVHRDVKPENILFTADGTPQLTDFGIARAVSAGTRMTATGMSIGSPHYMSPEQARGQAVDGRSDLYSLGVVFHEMLTGRVPYDADETLAVALSHVNDPVPELPAELAAYQPLLDRLLAKSPADRYADAAQVAAVLAADAPPATATRLTPVRRSEPDREVARGEASSRRLPRGLVPALAGGALAVAMAAVGYFALRGPEPGPGRAPGPGPAPVTTQPGAEVPDPLDLLDAEPAGRRAVLGGGALLVAETTPPGAEVRVDGTPVGRTPLERDDIRAGTREVVLEHPHYQRVREAAVDFEDGYVLRIERTLARARGALTVAVEPRAAWVEVDGQRLAEGTPVTLEDLPAGSVAVRLGAAGHRPLALEVDIPKDGLARLDRRLSPVPHGTLTLELAPSDAAVTLPDIEPRYRPGMRLPEGEHRVLVRRSGYRSAERRVRVRGDTVARIALERAPQAGDAFADALTSGGKGPQMVVVPAGSYSMGSPPGESGRDDDEGPVRRVTIGQPFEPFALGRTEVTFAQWDACAAAGGCGHRPDDEGWGRGARPVVNVSWNDARSYVDWLSAQTGESYRLPSEAEWEYAARAGTTTRYHWGDAVGRNRANCDGCGSRWDDDRTAPVGSFAANAFGLHDMHGNVWEWTADCTGSYRGAPSDGSARTGGDCSRRVLRGGSWFYDPRSLRAANRDWDTTGNRLNYYGFRVARVVRTLAP